MKRIITSKSDTNSSNNEEWVNTLAKEIKEFARSVIRDKEMNKYYRCRIIEIAEDRYGYPVVVLGIYNGSRCINEIEIGTFDGDNVDPYTTLTDDMKEYIREEVEYTLGE